MTDNQEKQLFSTLATLVTGVQVIQSDVLEIKETLNEHSQILNNHSETLDKHSQILNNHSETLDKHSQILNNHSKILDKHSQILNNHSETLDKHSQILNNHSKILDRHLQILTRLDAKTGSIAQAVINQDKRLSKAEKNIEELQSEVH